MKTCSRFKKNNCKSSLNPQLETNFAKDKRSPDGLAYNCKSCLRHLREKNKQFYNRNQRNYYLENKDELKQRQKTYRQKNKDHISETEKIYRNAHKQRRVINLKEWRNRNRERSNAHFKAHVIRKKTATPPWLTYKQYLEIRSKYRLAKSMTKDTGIRYTVDHIFPLKGLNFCGLHVPWNLQIITGLENSIKSNKIPNLGTA